MASSWPCRLSCRSSGAGTVLFPVLLPLSKAPCSTREPSTCLRHRRATWMSFCVCQVAQGHQATSEKSGSQTCPRDEQGVLTELCASAGFLNRALRDGARDSQVAASLPTARTLSCVLRPETPGVTCCVSFPVFVLCLWRL